MPNDLHFCAVCLMTRRMLLGIRYTVAHEVAPQQGYGAIRNNFSARELGWDDPPSEYEEENMAARINAHDVRDQSSGPGPVLLYSAQGDANYYIWFAELSPEAEEDEDDEDEDEDNDDEY